MSQQAHTILDGELETVRTRWKQAKDRLTFEEFMQTLFKGQVISVWTLENVTQEDVES